MAESSKTARKWIESLSLRVQQVLFGALTYLILLAICLLAISPEQYDLSVGMLRPRRSRPARISSTKSPRSADGAAADAVSPSITRMTVCPRRCWRI